MNATNNKNEQNRSAGITFQKTEMLIGTTLFVLSSLSYLHIFFGVT